MHIHKHLHRDLKGIKNSKFVVDFVLSVKLMHVKRGDL